MAEAPNPYSSPTASDLDSQRDLIAGQLHAGLGLVFYATIAMAIVKFAQVSLADTVLPIDLRVAPWAMVVLGVVRFAGQILCGSIRLDTLQRAGIFTSAFFQLWAIVCSVLVALRLPYFLGLHMQLGIDLLAHSEIALGCLSLAAFALFVKQSMLSLGVRGASSVGGYAFYTLAASTLVLVGGVASAGVSLSRNRMQPPNGFLLAAGGGWLGVGIGFVLLLFSIHRLRRALAARD